MSKITKELLQAIRPDIDAALAAVAKKHGLASLASGGCTYDPSAGNFTMKLIGTASGGKTKEAARYEQSAEFDKALPALGHVFKTGGASYSITGMNTTGTKVLAERLGTGRTFLFKRDAIIRLAAHV